MGEYYACLLGKLDEQNSQNTTGISKEEFIQIWDSGIGIAGQAY